MNDTEQTPGTSVLEPPENPTPKTSPNLVPPLPPNKPVTTAAPSEDFAYFEKILVSMPFFINRVAVEFEPLASNRGVLKLAANNPLVEVLKATADAKRGGIILIDENRWEELKKKLPFNPLAIKSNKHVLQVAPTQFPKKRSQPVASVVADDTISDGATGVGSVGSRGAGVGAGTPAPAPTSPPAGEFQPSVAKKSFKMPVLKKTTSRSLSGGTPDPDPTD